MMLFSRNQRCRAVERLNDLIAIRFEVGAQEITKRPIIFNDKDCRHAGNFLLWGQTLSSEEHTPHLYDYRSYSTIAGYCRESQIEGLQRNSTENRLPWPTTLSTRMDPPMAVTRSWTIARPSPKPPVAREREASVR